MIFNIPNKKALPNICMCLISLASLNLFILNLYIGLALLWLWNSPLPTLGYQSKNVWLSSKKNVKKACTSQNTSQKWLKCSQVGQTDKPKRINKENIPFQQLKTPILGHQAEVVTNSTATPFCLVVCLILLLLFFYLQS